MNVEVNYLAVFLAGASSMVVGSIWYAQSVFGSTWAKLAKVKIDKNVGGDQMFKLLGLTFLASLVTAYVLAHITYLSHQFFGNSFMQDAVTTAFWVWLGFTALRFWTHDMFEGRPSKLTVLNSANELITLVVMGLVIGAIGV
jgi:hypothetical protein